MPSSSRYFKPRISVAGRPMAHGVYALNSLPMGIRLDVTASQASGKRWASCVSSTRSSRPRRTRSITCLASRTFWRGTSPLRPRGRYGEPTSFTLRRRRAGSISGVKDFGSREIVGYAMGDRMTKDLVQKALRKALRYRRPRPGCIHHSDRGSQYCSHDYRKDLDRAGLTASMSRKGNCYDNAPTESFWGCLKQ